MRPIIDIRLVLDRDGRWRGSIEGEIVTRGHAHPATALGAVADHVRYGPERPSARLMSVTVYQSPEQVAGLAQLQAVTEVSTAARVREGIDLVLARYGA